MLYFAGNNGKQKLCICSKQIQFFLQTFMITVFTNIRWETSDETLPRDTGTNYSTGSMSIPMHFAHLLGLGLTIVSIATHATGFLLR